MSVVIDNPPTWLIRRRALSPGGHTAAEASLLAELDTLGGLRLRSVTDVSEAASAIAARLGAMSARQRNRLALLCTPTSRLPVHAALGTEAEELIGVAEMLGHACGFEVLVTSGTEVASLRLSGLAPHRALAARFVEGRWLEIEAMRRCERSLERSGTVHVGVEYDLDLGGGEHHHGDFDGLLGVGRGLAFIEAKDRHGLRDVDPSIVHHVAIRTRRLFRWSRQPRVSAEGWAVTFMLVAPSMSLATSHALAAALVRHSGTRSAQPTVVATGLSTLAAEVRRVVKDPNS